MNKLSSADWFGIAITLVLLILTAVDNAYMMFTVYGLAFTSGAYIIFKKSINNLGAIVIFIGSIIGITLTLIKLMVS